MTAENGMIKRLGIPIERCSVGAGMLSSIRISVGDPKLAEVTNSRAEENAAARCRPPPLRQKCGSPRPIRVQSSEQVQSQRPVLWRFIDLRRHKVEEMLIERCTASGVFGEAKTLIEEASPFAQLA